MILIQLPISTSFNTKFLPRLDFIHEKANLTTSTVGSKSKIYYPTGGIITGTTPVL